MQRNGVGVAKARKRKRTRANTIYQRTSEDVQSIPEKDLQGFCFQHSHIALSTHFSWQVEYGRHEIGNLNQSINQFIFRTRDVVLLTIV